MPEPTAAPTSSPAPAPTAAPPVPAATNEFRAKLIMLIMEALSERLMLWLGRHTLPLVMLAIGYALWRGVIGEPSANQLVGLGLYAAFSLLMLLIRRG